MPAPKPGTPVTSNPGALSRLLGQVAKPPQHLRMALGGMAGSGKTFLSGLTGTGTRILYHDIEDGSSTFYNEEFVKHPDAAEISGIDTISYKDLVDKPVSAQFTARIEGTFDHLIASKNKEGYSLVVVDSLTDLQAQFINSFTSNDPRIAYGAWSEAMYRIATKARGVPTSVLFLSRVRAVEDPVLGHEIIRFDVSPAAWSTVSGKLDSIGLVSLQRNALTKSVKQVLKFDSNPRFAGKDRVGFGELTNPSMAQLIAHVQAFSKQSGGGQ